MVSPQKMYLRNRNQSLFADLGCRDKLDETVRIGIGEGSKSTLSTTENTADTVPIPSINAGCSKWEN